MALSQKSRDRACDDLLTSLVDEIVRRRTPHTVVILAAITVATAILRFS